VGGAEPIKENGLVSSVSAPPAIPITGSRPVIAETKLHAPPTRSGAIRRARLVGELVDRTQSRLTLVAAPAGSGKTSLLAEWHSDAREQRSFAWISLDAADNDPVRFWDGVIAALRTVDPALGTSAEAALHSPGTTIDEHMLPLLINELSDRDESIVLALDDYHAIDNGHIHRQIETFIERLPLNVHVAIATRADPPLAMGRLRARAQLTEIRADDLRFNAAQAEAFLNETLGLDLDRNDVVALHDRTEGWVAGLQLAGLSLRDRDDRSDFISSFAGDDRQIVDYLGFEVLDHQPGAVREFLLQTSILDRLSAPLCAALTQRQDAAALLEELERANLFVVALDAKREWYRYHHLFGDLLRHELAQADPESLGELHQRAASWYVDQGEAHEAIEHFSAAGDVRTAMDLITTYWYEFLQRGRAETIAGWIDRLPAEQVAAEPDMCLIKAWLGINFGRLDEVDRWIGAADELTEASGGRVQMPPLESGVASLQAIHRYMDGSISEAVQAGRHALVLERGGPPSPWRPVGCPVLGLALHWHGEDERALTALRDAVGIAKMEANHLAAMHASAGLAAIEYERGYIEEALTHATEAKAIAEQHGLQEHWAKSLSLAVSGQVDLQRGDLEGAEKALGRAVELAKRGVASVEIAYALLALAELRRQQGNREAAESLHEEARRAVRACADPGILRELLSRLERRLRLTPRRRQHGASAPEAVTDAELAVLRLLRTDLSQREIGAELYISLNTVKSHTRSIYRKLGVATRQEAVDRSTTAKKGVP
jgi:LuxR family transcriptional regulator, maltose regulon positive regulatory protein